MISTPPWDEIQRLVDADPDAYSWLNDGLAPELATAQSDACATDTTCAIGTTETSASVTRQSRVPWFRSRPGFRAWSLTSIRAMVVSKLTQLF